MKLTDTRRSGMRNLLVVGSMGVLLLALTACWRAAPEPQPILEQEEIFSSSSSELVLQQFEGTIEEAGVSIYMQGTHRLSVEGADQLMLLESETVSLGSYVGSYVRLWGTVRPTVEAGGIIVEVEQIEIIQHAEAPVFEPTESSASSAEASLESSVASSTPPPPAASSRAAVRSSVRPVVAPPPTSSAAPAPAPSSAAPTSDAQRLTAAMAKGKVDATNFTQTYCSPHTGFCAPIHRNWYYQSFGTTSSFLWHVEASAEPVENLGEGPLIINLVSGALEDPSRDGTVRETGEFIVGYRAWTNNRHFQITAPKELRTAVQYIAENISVYQPETSSSGSASSGAN